MKYIYDKIPKPLRLYKNRELVFGEKDYYHNTMIIHIGNNMDDFLNFYHSGIVFTKYFKGYYIPRVITSKTLKNRKFIFEQREQYKLIKEKCPFVRLTKPHLSLHNSFNTIYDTSFELNKFNEVYVSQPLRKRADLFQSYFEEIMNKINIPEYKEYVIFVNPKSIIDANSTSFENILYTLSFYNILNESVFGNKKFVFYSNKTKMFFKVDGFFNKNKMELPRFKKLINLLYKLDNNSALTDEERETLNKEMDNINSDPTQNMVTIKPEEHIVDTVVNHLKDKLNIKDNSINSKQVELLNSIENDIRKTTSENPNMIELLDIMDNLNKNPNFLNNLNQLKLANTEYSNNKKNASVINDNIKSMSSIDDEDNDNEENNEIIEDEINDENINPEDEYSDDLLDDELDDFLNKEKSQARDKEKIAKAKEDLKAKQEKVTLGNGLTIKSILDDFELTKIDTKEIPINFINNEELKESKLKDLDKSYNKHQNKRDMALVLSAFNDDPDIPMFITDIKTEETSDSFSKKETMEITFEDVNNVKHNVKIDMPKIVDNSFLYINGGKKAISKQLTLLPVLKSKPDTVQITTNYSKMFLIRFGQKIDPNVERFKKFITKDISSYSSIRYRLGDNTGSNCQYVNTLEYDEISKFLIELSYKNHYFNFNREDSIYEIEDKLEISPSINDNEILFGYNKTNHSIYKLNIKNNEVLELDYENKYSIINKYTSIFDCISKTLAEVNTEIPNKITKYVVPKKMMYTRASVIGEKVPLIILLGFYFGFTKTIRGYNIEYKFSETKLNLTDEEKEKYGMFKFKDGYFYYPLYPLRNSLLINGLCEVPTTEISLSDLDNQDYYLELFDEMYNSANKSKGFNNFLSFFLDPITVDVCKLTNLPSDLLGLILYANSLLEDSFCQKQNDISNYRIRSNELINAHLYKILADGFKYYKDKSRNTRNQVHINIRQDQLIKDLVESPLVDEYSVLNPILEIEKLGALTFRGLSGINSDDAFTADIRAYDDSMMGCIGMNSPDSDKIGVVRQLSYSPKLINNRGMINNSMTQDEMSATNLFAPSELLSPFTATHSDPPQLGFYNRNIVSKFP